MSNRKKDHKLPDDLNEVVDRLHRDRPELDPLGLDRVKVRAMSGARRSIRQKGFFMKSRLTTFLTVGFLALGTGGAMALAGGHDGFGGGGGGSAAFHQYRPECPPGYELRGRSCRPIPPPKCGRGFEFSGGECIPTPPPTCPTGYYLNGRRCLPIPVPHCQRGYVYEDGHCVRETGHGGGGGSGGGGGKGGGFGGGGGNGGGFGGGHGFGGGGFGGGHGGDGGHGGHHHG
jgi:hypothetical protein